MSVKNEIDRITQNITNTYAVLEALGCEMPTNRTSDNLPETVGTSTALLYTEQTLTEEQKAQARTNIGSASVEEVNELIEEITEKPSLELLMNVFAEKAEIPTITQDEGDSKTLVMSQKAVTKLVNNSVTELNEKIVQQILVLTESELKALSQEELAEKYTKGTKILIVKENENLVRSAINSSGEIYNGCGYLTGYRLNSSGGVTENEGSAMTGFIPYTYGKEILIEGALLTADASGNYINTYNEKFELISCFYLSSAIVASGGTSEFDEENIRHDVIKTAEFTSSTYTNAFKTASFIRVSLNPCIGKAMSVSYR